MGRIEILRSEGWHRQATRGILSEVAASLLGPDFGPRGHGVEARILPPTVFGESLLTFDPSRPSIVVLGSEVRDQFLAHHPAQRIFQLHELDE
jgi:hypothetical protein